MANKYDRKSQMKEGSLMTVEADSTITSGVNYTTKNITNDRKYSQLIKFGSKDGGQKNKGHALYQPMITQQSAGGSYTFYKTVFDKETLWRLCVDDKPDLQRLVKGINLLNRILKCRSGSLSSAVYFCLGQTRGKADIPSMHLVNTLKDGGSCGFTEYDRHLLVYLCVHAESAAVFAYEWENTICYVS